MATSRSLSGSSGTSGKGTCETAAPARSDSVIVPLVRTVRLLVFLRTAITRSPLLGRTRDEIGQLDVDRRLRRR